MVVLMVAGRGSGGYVTVALWQLLAHTCVGVQAACAFPSLNCQVRWWCLCFCAVPAVSVCLA